jgi:phospholipid/cholesterol/gamma-HCH transport system substrate-binding protein
VRRSIPLKHKLGASGLAAVLVLTLVHLYTNVLGGSVGARPMHVTVALAETGGLYVGSGVSYRGVRVGSISDIALAGDHAEADVTLNPGTRVPSDTVAAVRTLSPAGEQFLDFQPRRGGAPYLADGDRVIAAHTSTPTTVAEVVTAVDQLMSQVEDDDVRTVIDELGTAFADPEDLGRVIAAGHGLVETLDSTWPETLRTLQSSRTVLRTGIATRDDFARFATSARSLTAWLEGYDPKLRNLIDDAPGQLEILQDVADDAVKALPPLLRELFDLTEIFVKRDPHVRELLIQFPKGLNRLVDVFAGGRFRTNIVIANGEVCSYGVEDSNPQDPTRTELDPDRGCPASFTGQQRGSAHAPGPTD